MVCFTTHLKQKSYEICEELVRLFRHFAKGNFSSRLANKAGFKILFALVSGFQFSSNLGNDSKFSGHFVFLSLSLRPCVLRSFGT